MFQSTKSPLAKIVRLLVGCRMSNYSKFPQVPPQLLLEISDFAKNLAKKILAQGKIDTAQRLTHEYEAAIDAMSDYNPESIICHAAQLLQYHTILCEPVNLSELDTAGLCHFLDTNKARLGSTDGNLFLVEYELIKIHNDLWHYQDVLLGTVAPVRDVLAKEEFLSQRLIHLASIIEILKLKYKDNIFCEYLDFSLQYCSALLVKVEYLIKQKELSDEECVHYVDVQKIFLNKAFANLDLIKKQQAISCYEAISGEAYFLGHSFSTKYPRDAIELNIQTILRS